MDIGRLSEQVIESPAISARDKLKVTQRELSALDRLASEKRVRFAITADSLIELIKRDIDYARGSEEELKRLVDFYDDILFKRSRAVYE